MDLNVARMVHSSRGRFSHREVLVGRSTTSRRAMARAAFKDPARPGRAMHAASEDLNFNVSGHTLQGNMLSSLMLTPTVQ
jgi:hypothetical protein